MSRLREGLTGTAKFVDDGHEVVAGDVGDLDVPRPISSAFARTAAAQPCGSSPPALETTLMPRSRQVPSTCSICLAKVRAQPEPSPALVADARGSTS